MRKKVIGSCIYCGQKAGLLNEEHPLPDALGSRIILTEASCSVCQGIINPFEQRILREVWGVARNRLNIKASRKRKREAATPKLIQDDGGIIDVPLDEALTVIFLLVPPSTPQIENGNRHTKWSNPSIKMRILGTHKSKSSSGTYEQRFKPDDFYRTLCKFAHGLTIWNYGPRYFEPILLDYILEGVGDPTQFIGASSGSIDPRHLHKWNYFEISYPNERFLAIKLQLFAPYVDVVYHIVVGRFPLPSNL